MILDWFIFALLCFVIGLQNSHHHLHQSNAKMKLISIWSPHFHAPQAGCLFLNCDFLLVNERNCVLIGRCNNFEVGFSTLSWKLLYGQVRLCCLLHEGLNSFPGNISLLTLVTVFHKFVMLVWRIWSRINL